MKSLRLYLVFALVGFASLAEASDAYLVRFQTRGMSSNCVHASWSGDAFFFNTTGISASVRLLGISNGELPVGSIATLTLPPGQLVALSDVRQPDWRPAGQSNFENFFVLHLDVPPSVVVESRDQVVLVNDCIQNQPVGPVVKLSLPIFSSLVASNKTQTFVGTDAGSSSGRQNIAIYNAGSAQATAHIEVRRGCDSKIVDERTASISGNSIIQVNGLSLGENLCPDPFVPVYARYTVVTVDQPSLVIVTTITTPQPELGGLVPRVEMAISRSSEF